MCEHNAQLLVRFLNIMDNTQLLGLYEIAELENVNPSAVANWRRRFSDFPAPIAELKSGPVFAESQVRLWLQRRKSSDDLKLTGTFYDQLIAKRGDSAELIANVEGTVAKLIEQDTSTKRPGILLGKIQSGKTRCFLGIIARAFDRGFDVAIILTKGTKSLARQTLSRVKRDFSEFIALDQMQVFDIMTVPELTPYELNQKLVFVVKKEDDNLNRLLDAFSNRYPALASKRVLIIDDEADFASVSFKKEKGGIIGVGTISKQIDQLRGLVADADFLQVTATPYSLYLQPEEDSGQNSSMLFLPKRPAFTEVLWVHDKYVGGNYYFDESSDVNSPAYYFYREVPVAEREALKSEDRRRLKIEDVLTERNSQVLREAVVTFLMGGAIRRLQQKADGERQQKYSFLFHTEQKKKAHEWQERVVASIRNSLIQAAKEDSPLFDSLLRSSYVDLKRSVILGGDEMPAFEDVKHQVVSSLVSGQLMITRVNSDKDIDELLDEDGQLRLRTPFNIFIGGQILDRGITLNNLIAFYYGRNPQRFQQDTVLQHSRMYGARSVDDLPVTRFYSPDHVFQIMRKIHEFDAALRDAFEIGAHERGVYFIQKDAANRLIPCSPNKLLFSEVVSVRPGRRLLPTSFQTVYKTNGLKKLNELDRAIRDLKAPLDDVLEIDLATASRLLELAYANLEFGKTEDDDRKAHVAILEHLSQTSRNMDKRGKVLLLVTRDRNVRRYREEGRFSNAPDTKQQADLARRNAIDIPVLMLLRQNGDEELGWRGLPFWWPVIVPPSSAVTSIFAADIATNASVATGFLKG